MLGIGGIFVELIKDVSFRSIPISKTDAVNMIKELKLKKILNGFRNLPIIDKNQLANLLLKISKISIKEKIETMDLNPVIFLEKEYYIVDSRLSLK